jgi:hypothetical protein
MFHVVRHWCRKRAVVKRRKELTRNAFKAAERMREHRLFLAFAGDAREIAERKKAEPVAFDKTPLIAQALAIARVCSEKRRRQADKRGKNPFELPLVITEEQQQQIRLASRTIANSRENLDEERHHMLSVKQWLEELLERNRKNRGAAQLLETVKENIVFLNKQYQEATILTQELARALSESNK